MTSTKEKFKWTEKHVKAFKEMKKIMARNDLFKIGVNILINRTVIIYFETNYYLPGSQFFGANSKSL